MAISRRRRGKTGARHALVIPGWHPTRLNQFLGRHWSVGHRLKKADAETIGVYAKLTRTPPATGKRRVSILITLGPRQRGGDPDGYLKSLLDGLVTVGLLVDDSPKWCELAGVAFDRGRKRCTTILLRDIATEPAAG